MLASNLLSPPPAVTDHHILTLSELDELVKKKGVTHVLNRHGEKMNLCLIRIKERIEKLAFGLDRTFVNIDLIIQKVVSGMYEGITTSHLDELSAETAAYLTLVHPDYSLLAARIAVSNLHKETSDSFIETITKLYGYIDNTGIHHYLPPPPPFSYDNLPPHTLLPHSPEVKMKASPRRSAQTSHKR